MSDTPTFASLLTQWSGGESAERRGVYEHLRKNPAEAAALEASIRDELNNVLPRNRIIAAEAMVEVYYDEAAAAVALSSVLRQGDPAAAFDAISVLQNLSPEHAGPLLDELLLHAPGVFYSQGADFYRWAARKAIQSGPAGVGVWLRMFARLTEASESRLLMGLADAAPHVTHDLSEIEKTILAARLHLGCEAGAALWRITWRVNRDWLASIKPDNERFESDQPLLMLMIEVLVEHLGRRPDLASLIRELLIRLGNTDTLWFRVTLKRLAKLGGRGWAVLLPMLGDSAASAQMRTFVFQEAAKRPAVLTLVHHHAHAVILNHGTENTSDELLQAAVGVLGAIGVPAGSAMTDILNLIVKQPATTRFLVPAIPALAPGHPNPVAAVARTLDRLRRSTPFGADGFAATAGVYAAMNLDGGLLLAGDTSFDPGTPDLLLQQSAWKDVAPEVRRRHAMLLADCFVSSRPEVRERAAELIRHYTDEMPAVWPALVAVLAGGDEKVALRVLPYFQHLAPVADAVTVELVALFREPNPTYAARAVIALWRLGRMPAVTDKLRTAAVNTTSDAWGWAVLCDVVDRVFQSPGLRNDLSRVFAASPPEVAAKVHGMLNPPESPEEAAISAHVRPENSPRVNWNGVHQCVCNDPEGGYLFLALMCEHGSVGSSAQKIWLIKHQRMLTGMDLGESKNAVESVIERLTATATRSVRQACVLDYFRTINGPPIYITDLLEHRVSWYRWAGLELLDLWWWDSSGHGRERVPELIKNRIWDRSVLVRARALSMHQG